MVHKVSPEGEAVDLITPAYGARGLTEVVPRDRLPDNGMPPAVARDLVRDELMLDGNARLNLATFVTTWMEPEARELITETLDKNMIDKDEYPQTAELERRCVAMLARLWHAPSVSAAAGEAAEEAACGCSTIGSSEAAMLAGMAMLWRWRARRRQHGQPTDRPNLVMGVDVQVCWEKFCRYWEVTPKLIPMKPGKYMITPEEVTAACDKNTIGVVAILGTTFTGQYEPIAAINEALAAFNQRTDLGIPLHVDAASGGFVAPFLQPDLAWDFRLSQVCSINASGHKYGLVYPGVGWALWRSAADLPEDLVFNVNYLGGDMPTFALSFSRPGAQVCAQYYNFLRLGFEGYRRVHQASQDTAVMLAEGLDAMGPFETLSQGRDIPVVAFRITPGANPGFTVFDLSAKLRERGWLVPAYTLPETLTDEAVLRIVVREGFTGDMAHMLLDDVAKAVAGFAKTPTRDTDNGPGVVRHHC